MKSQVQITRLMLKHIAEFFCFMADNHEHRLFYVLPINQNLPYAYQHSSIRDVATLCDILDLVVLCREHSMALSSNSLQLFEELSSNTLHEYESLYERRTLTLLQDGNIGDLGFFLLALLKCHDVFPNQLPRNWENTLNWIVETLIGRQRTDGSLEIFFDKSLQYHEKSSEAFYLPEALIGLTAVLSRGVSAQSNKVKHTLQMAIQYCCQETHRHRHMVSDTSTFYFNWQAKLLYHWITSFPLEEKTNLSLPISHLQNLIEMIKHTRIACASFQNFVATVEVACYLEGIVHARNALDMFNENTSELSGWFNEEISRCLIFLEDIQSAHLASIKGGFVHSQGDDEARVDVAGHVFHGLKFLI